MTPAQLSAQEQTVASNVKAILAASRDFRPFAVFDDQLDCIRVFTRDCSFKEIRVDNFLTVLEAHYPTSGTVEYVGFSIKGVAHLCERQGISSDGPWRLADFIDAVLAASNEPLARPIVHKLVRPLMEENALEDVERVLTSV
jgi:hypothetical protein